MSSTDLHEIRDEPAGNLRAWSWMTGVLSIAFGLVRVFHGAVPKGAESRLWLLLVGATLSGGLSALLGILLFLGLPSTAIWVIGLLIGIDIIFLGGRDRAFASAINHAGKRG